MKHYVEYLKYILEHKKNVFVECWKEGMYTHAFSHDLSKFSLKEFRAYADYFHTGLGVKYKPENSDFTMQEIIDAEIRVHKRYKDEFKKAWQHHKDNNKHHWNYWYERKLPMPYKYIKQMICDWKATGVKFGDTARDYYTNNYDKIKLDGKARRILNYELTVGDTNFSISTSKIKQIFDCKISSYLQGGYGIMLVKEDMKDYLGYIDFTVKDNMLGGGIIINNIIIYADKEETDRNYELYHGLTLEISDGENIW